jgi:hypothetical protein
MVRPSFIWVTEASAISTGIDALEQAVSQHGGIVRWIDVTQEMNRDYGSCDAGQTAIFRGSFEAAARCAEKPSGPVILGNLDDFQCKRYYPLLGEELLNADYILWPLGDLPRLWGSLPSKLGRHESYFLRSNSGSKAFSGQLVPWTNYNHFAKCEGCYLSQMASSELCLLAAPKPTQAEYRLLVVSGQVVGGSQHRLNGRVDQQAEVPEDILSYGQRIVDSLRGYAYYALDIARLQSGALAVIELNSLSCASWYVAAPEPVVAAVHANLQAGGV